MDKDKEIKEKFFLAAKEGNICILEDCLKQKKELINMKDEDMRTALQIAVSNNQQDSVLFLIKNNSNIDSQDDEGWSSLHSAASAGYLEIVKTLLKFLTNLELRTSSGCTALHYATSKGNLEIVKALLEAGANLKAKDNYGRSTIMKSVFGNHDEIFFLLLEHGASIHDVEKSTGENILHIAVNNQNVNICMALSSRWPSLLTQKNKENRTPYDECSNELKESLKIFLSDV